MVRTLTLISALALVAGLSVGVFAGQVFGERGSPAGQRPVPDAYLETQVRAYVEHYGLTTAQADQVRAVLHDYDVDLQNLLRVLRLKHQDDFHALRDRANARMKVVLGDR